MQDGASHIQVGHNNSDSDSKINPASQADPLSNPISFMVDGHSLSVDQDASPVTFPRPWFWGKLIGLRKFGTDADKPRDANKHFASQYQDGSVFQTTIIIVFNICFAEILLAHFEQAFPSTHFSGLEGLFPRLGCQHQDSR